MVPENLCGESDARWVYSKQRRKSGARNEPILDSVINVHFINMVFSKIKESLPPVEKVKIYIEGLCHSMGAKTCPESDEGKMVGAQKLYILEEYYKNQCTSGDLAIIELNQDIGDHGAVLSTDPKVPTSGNFMVSGFGKDRGCFFLIC